MSVIKILPDIYSVGVVDWNVRNFHGHTYTTKRGTTYNAYLSWAKNETKPKDRIAAVFGSYGWAGGAVKEIEGIVKEAGIEIAQPGLGIKYVPDENEMKRCYEYGKDFAKIIRRYIWPWRR